MKTIWSGIYNNFEGVIESKDAFSSQKWIYSLTKNIKKNNIKNIKSPEVQYLNTFKYLKKNSYLKSKICLVDYGGGLGNFYFKLSNFFQTIDFDWHIIEKNKVVKVGNNRFRNEKKIKFKNRIYFRKKVDIFFAGSSMQYINDWNKLLSKFIKKDVKIFVFCDLPLVNTNQLITKQNYFGINVPVRFYNLDVLEKFFYINDYILVYKKKFRNYYEKYTSKELKKYNLNFNNVIFIKKGLI